MSCNNCKSKDNDGVEENLLSVFKRNPNKRETEPTTKDFGFQLFNISVRLLIFAISLLATPLIMVFVVYLLFKTIMLNNGQIDLMPVLLKAAKGFGIGKKKVEEEHPEDYEDLNSGNPEEYEIDERVDKVEL